MTPTPGGAEELRKQFEAETDTECEVGVHAILSATKYVAWLESRLLSLASKHAEEMKELEAANPINHIGVESPIERAKWTFSMHAAEIRRLTARLSALEAEREKLVENMIAFTMTWDGCETESQEAADKLVADCLAAFLSRPSQEGGK